MTPECRAWIERMTAQWAARAAARRAGGTAADLTIAAALESTVAELRARASTAPVIDPLIAELERQIASIAPRPGPHGVTFNTGAIMAAVRHRLQCQLAAARGEAPPDPPPAGQPPDPPPCPPPEALPFTSGPQLDLFAC